MELKIALFTVALAACRPSVAPDASRLAEIEDVDGGAVSLEAIAARAPLTVFVFFSAHCPCQRAHDARLSAIHADYAARGVQIVAIDVEVGASRARAAREAAARRYPFPILVDARGGAADALGAEYATFSAILDQSGRVRYRGGVDSDRTHLTNDAKTYLRDALDELLDGREPREPNGKVLGCALMRR